MAVYVLTHFKRYLEAKCFTVQSLQEHHLVQQPVPSLSHHLTKAIGHQRTQCLPHQPFTTMEQGTLVLCHGNLQNSTRVVPGQHVGLQHNPIPVSDAQQPPSPPSSENKAVHVQQTSSKPRWHQSEGDIAVF